MCGEDDKMRTFWTGNLKKNYGQGAINFDTRKILFATLYSGQRRDVSRRLRRA
jgi:hypothetical protein